MAEPTPEKLRRAEVLLAMRSRAGLDLIGPDGSVRRLEGDTALLADAMLAFCVHAERTRAEIRAHVEELTGAPIGTSTVLDELVTLLREAGALRSETPGAPRVPTNARVIVAMGGAVAAAHAPRLVQALQAYGHEVRVIASERALRFVAREALEALTHAPVLTSMWADDERAEGPSVVPHVELASWADVVLVWPATATMISRIATGDCSELVSAVAITTRAPVLVAPSMNEAMLDAAAVARNVETLRNDGLYLTTDTPAHEVAEGPEARRAMRGGAPDPDSLACLVDALARASRSAAPSDAASWERFHRRVPEAEQAWVSETPDSTVMRCIETHTRPQASLWDVGTGHGAIAIAAAARGHCVVATDVSETALARARDRAPDAPIVWLRDDVTASALRALFEVIVDRGTLHTLAPAQRTAYAAQISARTRPGSIVVVTVHLPPADPRVQSHPMGADEVAALFGERFEILETVSGTFSGALVPGPACVTCVLRRR